MKKYIVLSVNENPQYLFYLPLTIWAWRKFGWEPIIFSTRQQDEFETFLWAEGYLNEFHYVHIPNYKTETVAQISRLYASCKLNHCMIMTGDVDMIPLSDYWKPKEDEITVYGHDLTNFEQVPICYVAMNNVNWDRVMLINSDQSETFIKRDLENLPANSEKFEEWWTVDQQLITMRLKPLKKTLVNRGVLPNGYAYGRVDRSAWTLNHKELIDAHLLRDIWKNKENYDKTMELLRTVWPNENFAWFEEYVKEFAKLNP